MAKEKKMTKKERFERIMAKYNLTADEKDFIAHEIELLDKRRNSKNGDRKPTAKQAENADYKDIILEYLADHPDEKFTITDLWKNVPELAGNPDMSNQRISSLVRQLLLENLVIRNEIKRKAYFSIAVTD